MDAGLKLPRCRQWVTLGVVRFAAEIIKRRIMGLHQDTEIGSVDITDTWEPLEEGLNRLETTRHVSVITITLSTAPLDTTSVGYQPPIEDDLVKPLQESGAGSSTQMRNPGRRALISHDILALHKHSYCLPSAASCLDFLKNPSQGWQSHLGRG